MRRALGARIDASAPDLTGHGAAPDWDEAGDYHDQATALARDAMPAGRMHLVGHSLGATIALRLALEDPARVRSLTLIEPVLFAAARGRPGHAANAAASARIFAILRAGDAQGAARDFTAIWGAGAPWEALSPAQRAYMAARIGLVLASAPALEDDRAGLLAPGGLEGLGMPALLIEGSESPPVIGEILGALAARLPDARRVRVEGAGHMAPVTHPAEVAAAIADLLGG